MREPWSVHHNEIIALVNKGCSVEEVASALGVDPKKTGAEISRLRSRGLLSRAANSKIRFTPDMDQALRAAVAAGSSFKEHARNTGLSCTVIQRRAKNLGLRSPHLVEIDWDQAKSQILAMREAGSSWRAIGEAIGASDSSVRRIAKAYSLPKRKPSVGYEGAFWTPERKSILLSRLAQGTAYSQIAAEIGGRATRKSVCHTVMRMKRKGEIPAEVLAFMVQNRGALQACRLAEANAFRAAKPKSEKPKPVKRERPPKPQKLPKALPAPAAARAPLPSFTLLAAEREPVDLIDLQPGMCRWPYGETAPFKFCGCRVSLGSYCPAHAAVAHPAGRIATIGVHELSASKLMIDGATEWLRA